MISIAFILGITFVLGKEVCMMYTHIICLHILGCVTTAIRNRSCALQCTCIIDSGHGSDGSDRSWIG